MTEQDKQALIKHFCSRDCGEAAEGCTIMPCHEIELIQEFQTTEADSDTISRAKAIEALKQQAETMNEWSNRYAEQRKGILTAVNIVEDLPPAQLGTNLADVGTDCISRQALLDKFEPWLKVKDYNDGELNMLKAVLYEIRFMRPAQPERIKGRWVEKPHVHGVAYCSLCDYELHTNDTNFCPNCGAKMEATT